MELGLLFSLLTFVPGLTAQLSSSGSPCGEPWADPASPPPSPQLLPAQTVQGLPVGWAGSVELMVD